MTVVGDRILVEYFEHAAGDEQEILDNAQWYGKRCGRRPKRTGPGRCSGGVKPFPGYLPIVPRIPEMDMIRVMIFVIYLVYFNTNAKLY